MSTLEGQHMLEGSAGEKLREARLRWFWTCAEEG